jgi:hypothetical protein
MRLFWYGTLCLALASAGIAYRSHLRAGATVLSEQISYLLPDRYKIAIAREHVKRVKGECDTLQVKLEEARDRKKSSDMDRAQIARRIEKQQRTKADGEQLLSRRGDFFLIGGRRYSRAAITRDVQTRASNLRLLGAQLESKTAISTALAKAIEIGEANLSKAQEHAGLLNARVESLAVELQAARVRGECSDLASQIVALTSGDTAFDSASSAVEELAARVHQVDLETRRREAYAAMSASDQVDWDAEPFLDNTRLASGDSDSDSDSDSDDGSHDALIGD